MARTPPANRMIGRPPHFAPRAAQGRSFFAEIGRDAPRTCSVAATEDRHDVHTAAGATGPQCRQPNFSASRSKYSKAAGWSVSPPSFSQKKGRRFTAAGAI